ncbi:hypothetical protein HPP92_020528 [Vanilla planifolia]|uniref:MHD domain-containing protein n=1 Tax=Vanilla planifolia TaxID=51239 RepID=A0A835Q7E7_VANPL|nr:hypothetical protein HPP92_020528 [Vanilla planifolia]
MCAPTAIRCTLNLQALGGHQTAHRKEIEEMRRQHDAQVHESRLQGGQSNSRSGSSRKAAIAAEGSSVDLELTLGTGESGLGDEANMPLSGCYAWSWPTFVLNLLYFAGLEDVYFQMQQHLVFLGEKLTLKAQAMKFTLILLKNWMLLWADWWDGRLQQKFRRYIQEEELTMDSSWMLDDLSRGCLILVTEELQKLNERMESAFVGGVLYYNIAACCSGGIVRAKMHLEIEDLDRLLQRRILSKCEVYGEILVNSHLPGLPDLTLSFANPAILNDVRFHPCVRFRPWESNKFSPLFLLMESSNLQATGWVKKLKNVPIYVKPQLTSSAGNCQVNVLVGIRNDPGKVIENLTVQFQLPSCVGSADLKANHGTVNVLAEKICSWSIGRIQRINHHLFLVI